MKIFNELWLGKEASYCWPGLFCNRARLLRDTFPTAQVVTCYAFGAIVNVNLQGGPIIWQSTLLVGKLACTLPMKAQETFSWWYWSGIRSLTTQCTRTPTSQLTRGFIRFLHCKLISVYKCINNSMKRLISIHSLKKPFSNSLSRNFISRLLL